MYILDLLVDILNSNVFYYVYLVAAVFFIVVGILMFIGIQTKGKVLLIDSLFKKKEFHREKLKNRYRIQAFYTSLIGLALLIVLITVPFNGVVITLWMLLISLLDFLYDVFAIKTATKGKN